MGFSVIKINIPEKYYPIIDQLCKESAVIWNKSLDIIEDHFKEDEIINLYQEDKKSFNNFFNKLKTNIQKIVKSNILYSQSTQATIDYLIGSFKTYIKNKIKNDNHNKPSKRERYIIIWKSQSIKFSNNSLILPLARGNNPLTIKLKSKHIKQINKVLNENDGEIKQVIITKKHGKYIGNIIIKYKDKKIEDLNKEKNLFIDIGEIHPFVCYNEQDNEFLFFNGKYIRSLKHRRFKLISIKQKKLSKKEKNSIRYNRVEKSLNKQIWKTERQIEDLENKYIKNLIDYCIKHKIGKIIIGDLKNIRSNVKYNKNSNRKIHLIWRFGKLIEKLKYKASTYGIKVEEVNEKYSSQLCPICGSLNKTNNRNYKCSKCGFKLHRDLIGVLGIVRNFYNFKLKRGYNFKNVLEKDNLIKIIGFKINVFEHIVYNFNNHIRVNFGSVNGAVLPSQGISPCDVAQGIISLRNPFL